MTASRDAVAGAALSSLTVLVLASQVYGRQPAWRVDESSLLNSDTLLFQDLYLHLVSGGSTEEWVTSIAPVWLSDASLTFLAMAVSGSDILLSTALMAAVLCLLLTWSLSMLVRRASGFTAGRSWLHAAAAVAALVALLSVLGSWTGSFGSSFRTVNLVLFFFACTGLAAVLAAGRANRPLTWCYLAACPLLGLSDVLLLFHVALPVLATSVLWRITAGGGRDAGLIVAAAALGAALCLGGYLSSEFVQTEILSFKENVTATTPLIFVAADRSGIEGGAFSALGLSHFAKFILVRSWDYLAAYMTGRNAANALLVSSVIPLLAWASLAGVRRAARRAPGDPGACARFVVVAMVCSLLALCALLALVIEPNVMYVLVAMWAPFLSLAVAWARTDLAAEGGGTEGASVGGVPGPGCRVAPAGPVSGIVVGLAALVLAADLAFFRPAAEVSERHGCYGATLGGTGLSRGVVPYWNAREVSLFSGNGVDHLVYFHLLDGPHAYPHNGSVRHTEGDADYVVVERDRPESMNVFRNVFGLPSAASLCRREVYMLYYPGRLDGDLLLPWG